jgi:hypothetical protein
MSNISLRPKVSPGYYDTQMKISDFVRDQDPMEIFCEPLQGSEKTWPPTSLSQNCELWIVNCQ